jgi:hypothetical protein
LVLLGKRPVSTGTSFSPSSDVIREAISMWQRFGLALLVTATVSASLAFAADQPALPVQDTNTSKPAQAAPKVEGPRQEKTKPAPSIEALQDLLERQSRELSALKDQYAREQQQQQKRAELQQQQIEILQRTAELLTDQIRKQAGGARSQGAIEKLQAKTELLESRAQQAARRDQELANKTDDLTEQLDAQTRYGPQLPATLKGLFAPTPTNVSPFTIFNTVSTRYDLFTKQRGAGQFQFEEFTPFLLVQLNKRFLLSAETSFTQGGVSLGQAQLDMFINDWLTMDVGYFLAPIGFWNERLDPRWINKLPDIPLVMRQVIPDGLTTTGLQFRGAKYLFGSPVKMEYSVFATNGLGVPGMGKAADWADLGALIGTTGNVNNAMAYGGRIGFWLPARGINFGVSEFVSVPYSFADGAVVSVWQPYFNYHYGNWDYRFEYGNMFEATKPFIGNNINRSGFYTQLAYRNYQSIHKHLQRLEAVFRYSQARFSGIQQGQLNLTSFSPPMTAPVNDNQYTIGLNYYFYPSTILKFAYEINEAVVKNFHANVFMMQFATNF